MDKGPSLSRFVNKAIDAVESTGLSTQVTPMGTIIEAGTIDEIFEASKAAVDAVAGEGSERISLSLKIDIRLDKDITMASKLKAVGR